MLLLYVFNRFLTRNVNVTDHLSLLSVCNGKSERLIKRFSKLLYTSHVTPVIDIMGIKKIAEYNHSNMKQNICSKKSLRITTFQIYSSINYCA